MCVALGVMKARGCPRSRSAAGARTANRTPIREKAPGEPWSLFEEATMLVAGGWLVFRYTRTLSRLGFMGKRCDERAEHRRDGCKDHNPKEGLEAKPVR